MKVLIIGAGWSGIQAAAMLKNRYGCEVVIFDQNANIGGTWAKGIAYSHLTTHAAASTIEFVGYPFPKDIVSNPLDRVPTSDVVEYMKRYVDDTGLGDDIRLNSQVETIHQISEKEVRCIVRNAISGEKYTEDGEFVMLSGFGFKARKFPNIPGASDFEGSIYTSHDVSEAALEKLKKSNRPVVVAGGSKAAHDIINTLVAHDIPVEWVARKTYWMYNYDKGIYHRKKGRRSKPFDRLKALIGHLAFGFLPKTSMRLLRLSDLMLNVHPETSAADYHLGVVDYDMVKVARSVPFTQGEIVALQKDKVVIQRKGDATQKLISCSAIIACFGTEVAPNYPEFKANGEKVDILKAKHLFQFSIHQKLPRLYFMGPIALRGLGMLNGYHAVQHAIIYLSKRMTDDEVKIKTKQEQKLLKRFFKTNDFKPQLARVISDIKNLMNYLKLVDSIGKKLGYSYPLNLGPAMLLYGAYYKNHSKPVYREPTEKEVISVFGHPPNKENANGIPNSRTDLKVYL
ncbi:NAD(P)/FAD-dependent oxidoreductase [Exilibacterium tricleocarpae]|uniref:NAD(P)/FAD-dependent oxidoreductase n=1 Tax=Exilibacterium tricleocarpae TaxID=2591008 RepID=A0A545SZ02_9GAMM|nr:FAD-dependent oxidoreductase [Exilibacterium tricleocarpae]TQV70159.1 NAD(P)/FAD-dependent oxidoreductase [Exilibacterium tricleocarpae]